MATAAVRGVLAAIRRSDADLLRRFAAGRDDAAFAELVRRHGPLVLGVCRRVVTDRHLADDAFQAAFVVLANKAGGLDADRPLGPWLYGVAFRVALRARLMIGRRRKRETLTATVPEVAARVVAADDMSAIVDEEISRLSAVGREAVVLCEMQGLSRKEAAARLGVAEGTLSSRLAAARKTLAVRLRQRGVTLAGGLLGATTLVPSGLFASTVAASTGKVELSTQITTLVEGATHMALLSKLKLAVVATAVFLLSAGGFGVWSGGESIAAPVPKEKDDAGLIWTYNSHSGALTAYTPDGKKDKAFTLKDGRLLLALTPDGQQLLYAAKKGAIPDDPKVPGDGLTLHLRPVGEKTVGTDLGIPFDPKTATHPVCFSADGKKLVYSRMTDAKQQLGWPCEHVVVDLESKRETVLKQVPDGHILDVSAGGTWALVLELPDVGVNRVVGPGAPPVPVRSYKLHKVPLDGSPATVIAERAQFTYAAIAPDGKTVLASGPSDEALKGGAKQPSAAVLSIDVASNKVREMVSHNLHSDTEVGWSPDGRRMAYLWLDVVPLPKFPDSFVPNKSRLVVCDPDGKNPTTWDVHDFADDPKGYTQLLGWRPAKPDPRRKNAPVPKDGKDDGLIWTHNTRTGELTAYTPDGTKVKELTLKDGDRFLGFTPDGKQILFAGKSGKLADEGDTDGLTLHLRDITDKPEGTDTGLGYSFRDQFVVSPDGTQIVRQRHDKVSGRGVVKHEYSHVLFDRATKKETPIDLPTDHQIMQWTEDGKTWRVFHSNLGDDPKLPNYRCLTATVGGKPKLTPTCDDISLSFLWLASSPDGKTLLGAAHKPVKGGSLQFAWMSVDPTTGKATDVKVFDGVAFATFRQSPDGKRVAWMKYDYDVNAQQTGATRLQVYDADGKNETKLFTAENDGQNTRLLGWFPTRPADARRKNAPPPKAAPPEGVFLIGKSSHAKPGEVLEVADTAGKTREHLPVGELMNVQQARVSPDGSKLAFVRFVPRSSRDKWGLYAYPQDVYVVDLPLTAPPKEPAIKGVIEPSLAWAADGKSLFVSSIPADTNLDQDGIKGQMIPKKTVRYDVAAKTEKAVELPQWHAVLDATPDGKTLLTRTHLWGGGFASPRYTNYLVPLDTLKPKVLGVEDDGFAEARLSPDGARVVGTRGDYYKAKDAGVYVADVKSNAVERVPVADDIAAAVPSGVGVVWAPDGKRLAVLWQGVGGGGVGAGGGGAPGGGVAGKRLAVMDADGKNAKTVREFAADEGILRIEWAAPKLADAKK